MRYVFFEKEWRFGRFESYCYRREMKKAQIQLYTGDGKGKTTAAVGLAARALGHGLRVLFVQFMKNRKSGEIDFLELCGGENFKLLRKWDGTFILSRPSEEQAKMCGDLWRMGLDTLERERYDMVVFDEITVALSFGLLSESSVIEFLRVKPLALEVVLTGQGATKEIVEACDLVSEIRKIKHYYDKGIKARKGVEY